MLLPNNINLPARCRLVFKKNRWFICISKPTRGVLMGVEPTESSSKRGVVGALDEFDGVAKQREEGPSEDDEGEGGVEVDSDELGGSGGSVDDREDAAYEERARQPKSAGKKDKKEMKSAKKDKKSAQKEKKSAQKKIKRSLSLELEAEAEKLVERANKRQRKEIQ